MKRYTAIIIILLIIVLSYFAFPLLITHPVKTISLTAGDFEHIQFSTKNPTIYRYQKNVLVIEVDNSASFLMQAFDTVKHVNNVSFEWKSNGLPTINDAGHEARREGDDAVFKLGLLIEADEELTSLFLPLWMRRVNELLNFYSGEMFFLVAGAKHAAQQDWPGPYNKRMTMIAMENVSDFQGWSKASYQFSEPVKVVALWLMADGDDTSSSFTVHVKNISLE